MRVIQLYPFFMYQQYILTRRYLRLMDLIFSCLCAYVLVLVVYIKQYNYFNYEISSKTTNHSYHRRRIKTWYKTLTNAEHMKIKLIHSLKQTYLFTFYLLDWFIFTILILYYIVMEHKHFKVSNFIFDLHFFT